MNQVAPFTSSALLTAVLFVQLPVCSFITWQSFVCKLLPRLAFVLAQMVKSLCPLAEIRQGSCCPDNIHISFMSLVLPSDFKVLSREMGHALG